jgi:hypothetical protein
MFVGGAGGATRLLEPAERCDQEPRLTGEPLGPAIDLRARFEHA